MGRPTPASPARSVCEVAEWIQSADSARHVSSVDAIRSPHHCRASSVAFGKERNMLERLACRVTESGSLCISAVSGAPKELARNRLYSMR